MLQKRQLKLLGATGQIRTATYHGREHLVVPLVALMEGVVWPVNAEFPEFVPAEELGRAPDGWNGRPVVMNHPENGNGDKISANDPATLERYSYGSIFNTGFKDNKLGMEMWLDVARAKQVGPDAERVCERARNDEPIEVSVGCFLSLEKKSGSYKGKKYEGVWHDIVPDHLATLPEGMVGACSVEMGCGAPRVAAGYLVTPNGLVPVNAEDTVSVRIDGNKIAEVVVSQANPQEKKSLGEKLRQFFSRRDLKARDDMGQRDIERAIDKVLRDSEPGYLGIDDIFPNDKLVVYATMDSEYQMHLFRRSYKIAPDGVASIGDERTEVEPVTRYEALSAEPAPKAQPTTACGCVPKGENAMNRDERIAALIAKSKGRFTEADKTWLTQVPEDRLSALEGEQQPPPSPQPQPAPKPVGDPPPSQPAPSGEPLTPDVRQAAAPAVQPKTVEQFLEGAPADVQEAVREGVRIANEQKQAIIVSLQATKRCPYSEEQLKGMSLGALKQLAQLAAVPDPVVYDGRPLPRAAEQAEGVPPPPSLIRAVADKNQKAS